MLAFDIYNLHGSSLLSQGRSVGGVVRERWPHPLETREMGRNAAARGDPV
jgi:hypothetical protein